MLRAAEKSSKGSRCEGQRGPVAEVQGDYYMDRCGHGISFTCMISTSATHQDRRQSEMGEETNASSKEIGAGRG